MIMVKGVKKYFRLNKYTVIASLLLIFLAAVVVRFYGFNNPIADWHSWRQADTAAVTRNFVKQGYTPLYPKFDAENSLNAGSLPNPNRYFFAEFPIYNSIVYAGYTVIGTFTIEQWGRLVSIFFSSLAVVWLFLLVRLYSGERVALIAAGIYALLPYNIFYGQVIMPDPMHVSFGILSLYLVSLWTQKGKWWWAVLAGLAYAVTVLTKPYGLVLLLPIGYLIFRTWKFKAFARPALYFFAALGLIPLALWRQHISGYPEGQFATDWLFNQGNIRFTGAYFRWLIFDRMNRLIFATGGFVLFWIGIIVGNTKKEGYFYYFWLASIFLFFIVIAKGNVTHDYYQMPLVPIGAIFIAKGVDFLLTFGKEWFQKSLNIGIAAVLLLVMLAFGWYEVRDYFNINRRAIVEAGRAADRLLPKDAKVIAPYDLDPAFLYQTNRYGWTIGADKIPQWINAGAGYLVSVNYDDPTNYYISHCHVVERTTEWVIVDLKKCDAEVQEKLKEQREQTP